MQHKTPAYCLLLTLIVTCCFLAGCCQYRLAYTPMVSDEGGDLKTRNKYRVSTWLCRFDDGTTHCMDTKWIVQRHEEFVRLLPNVFSTDGIPVRIIENKKPDKQDNWGAWTILVPYMVSFFTLPVYAGGEIYTTYEFEFDGAAPDISVQLRSEQATAVSMSPVALLLPMGDYSPEPGRRSFSEHGRKVAGDAPHTLLRDRALAYGLAVRLKELEAKNPVKDLTRRDDAATVVRHRDSSSTPTDSIPEVSIQSPTLHQQAVPSPEAKPLYNILSCKREASSDFSYRFELELLGKNSSLHTFRAVQQEFRQAVKDDYVESTPGAKSSELFVEFPEYELKNGHIEGRAVVLTISVTSLAYDPNTRAGKLAVKVNANQYEEARKWIRKNIETLARDKNIALTTGEIPPAAKFYLGREELKDGNVLEIEFRTE